MTDIYKERFLSTFPKESRTDMKICDKDWHCKVPVEENWNIALLLLRVSGLQPGEVNSQLWVCDGDRVDAGMPSCHITHRSMNTRPELLSSWTTCHKDSQSPTHHLGGVDRPTYKYHLRNDKKVLSWLVLLSPRLWCWYVAPPYGPANPRQTCRAQSPGRNSSSFSSGIVGQDWTCESLAETD